MEYTVRLPLAKIAGWISALSQYGRFWPTERNLLPGFILFAVILALGAFLLGFGCGMRAGSRLRTVRWEFPVDPGFVVFCSSGTNIWPADPNGRCNPARLAK